MFDANRYTAVRRRLWNRSSSASPHHRVVVPALLLCFMFLPTDRVSAVIVTSTSSSGAVRCSSGECSSAVDLTVADILASSDGQDSDDSSLAGRPDKDDTSLEEPREGVPRVTKGRTQVHSFVPLVHTTRGHVHKPVDFTLNDSVIT